MKKLQILVTIAFIISIMSFGAFAMPEAGAAPNSNVENSNTEKGNVENNNTGKSNVENNNTEKSNVENNNTGKSNVENNNTGKSNVENNNTGKSNVENNNTEKSNVENNNTGKSNVENNNTGKSNVENNNKEKSKTENKGGILKKDKCGKCKDPLKRLEERKESIRKDLKEGKITKEKAEELTKKIDERIAKVKEFNSLTLPQKKEHLSKNFSSHLEKQIKDGRITKEEGEKIQADFNKQLESWDGKEPPKFMHKIKKHRD